MRLYHKTCEKIIKLFDSRKTFQEIRSICGVLLADVKNIIFKDKLKRVSKKEISWEEESILREQILNEIKNINNVRERKKKEEKKSEANKKDAAVLKLYKSGKTLEEIGNVFDFTRSRAQQIVTRELRREILGSYRPKGLDKEDLMCLDAEVKEEIKKINLERSRSEKDKDFIRISSKIDKFPYIRFTSLSSYAKTVGEDSGNIKRYFPEIAEEIIQKGRRLWSRHYNKCRACGTSSVKHASHGLCKNCYPQSDIFKDMQEASRLRNMHKRKKRQREYSKEYFKRPEVIAKVRKRGDERRYGGNRKKAIERDNFKCQKCGISRDESNRKFGKDLYVYHIGDTKDNRLENLITVCKNCHNKRVMNLMHKIHKKHANGNK